MTEPYPFETDGTEPRLFENLFLSIGAMKAGTTWLYAVLSRHPELHFSLEKEVHYFYHRFVDHEQLNAPFRLHNARNRYILRFDPQKANIARVRENLRWVSAYLDGPVDDIWYRNLFNLLKSHTYACDFSNLTAHIPAEAWPHVLGMCSRLKVLYTMRDPVKRLWSHTKFHLQVTNQLEMLDEWGPEEFDEFVRKPFIWDNAEYGAVLRRIGVLPEEARMVIFYEDIHKDQIALLRRIEDFLGISHFDYPEQVLDRRYAESERREMPEFFPSLFAEDIARIRAEVAAEGYAIPETWG